MEELALKVIPINLSMLLLSPVPMALLIIVLSAKKRGLANALGLFFGIALVPALVILASIFVGDSVRQTTHATKNALTAVIDLTAGAFLLWEGLRLLFDKNYTVKAKHGLGVLGWFVFGLVVQGTDFGQILICFNAAKEVTMSSINAGAKALFLSFNFFCFVAPLLLPLLYYIVFPKSAKKYLAILNGWIIRNIRRIVIVISSAFGLVFIIKGLQIFL